MKETYTKTTNYKVMDVRECVGDTDKPVVLICKELHSPVRRRIEVYPCDLEAYSTALYLAPGDIIFVRETYNYNGDGSHRIDDIEY